jgi:hypothetical protein
MKEFIILDIEEKLNDIKNRWPVTNRGMITLEIKMLFARLGQSFGVYANRMGENKWEYVTDEKEYLYDLLVLQEDENPIVGDAKTPLPSFIRRAILAVECEFSQGLRHAVYDFQKLLISNADFKVFVCKCHSTQIKQHVEFFETNLNIYENLNGRFFLFITVTNDLHTFYGWELIKGKTILNDQRMLRLLELPV